MPPPPPPSASYNLKLDDFSDSEEEENDYYSQSGNDVMDRNAPTATANTTAQGDIGAVAVHHTDGYLVEDAAIVVSLTELRQQYADGKVSKEEFAAALRAHQANIAANNDGDGNSKQMPEVVEAFNVTALTDDSDDNDEEGDDDDDDDLSGNMDVDEQHTVDGEISSPVRKKKKKKKKVGVSHIIMPYLLISFSNSFLFAYLVINCNECGCRRRRKRNRMPTHTVKVIKMA